MTEIHRMKVNTLSEAKREALRNFGKTDGSQRVCVVELDSQGNPVSASYTRLPGDQAWVTVDMQEEPNIEDLLVDACAGILPPDFDRWELADMDGYTVRDAHKNCRKVLEAYNEAGE